MTNFNQKNIRVVLTPSAAIQILKDGNKRFVNNLKLDHDLLHQVNETSNEQNPFAIILSCIDSRTSAELIFNQGLGDIFSCRIAGNILNDDIVGSMEFACKLAGAKLIMVLGHTECGAVKGACDNVEMGKLTTLLQKISAAIKLEKTVSEMRNSNNPVFVEKVALLNVEVVMNQIPEHSEVIKDMLHKNEIAIISGMYDVATGVVTFEGHL